MPKKQPSKQQLAAAFETAHSAINALREAQETLDRFEFSDTDPIECAKYFIRFKEVVDRLDTTKKSYGARHGLHKEKLLPERFEQAKLKSPVVTDDQGQDRRLVVQAVQRCGVRADKKNDAINWLRSNGHGEIVQETINASTLTAFAKELSKENRELPDEIFNVHIVNNVLIQKAS